MDERTIELIHGDIDGELDAAQRAELGRILEASAEARSEHERLQALSAMMAGLPECAPPPGLRESILAVARPPARVNRRTPGRKRTGLGLAAALAATVVGIAVFIGQLPEFAELDASALAGTLGRPLVDGPPPAMRLDGAVVSGTIMLHRGKEGLALEVDLNASKPVEIVAAASGARLDLQGFVRVDGAPSGMDAEGGTVRVSHAGRQHYVLVLASDDMPAAIELAVFDGEELIQETRLAEPGG
jgi:hypothetical protein